MPLTTEEKKMSQNLLVAAAVLGLLAWKSQTITAKQTDTTKPPTSLPANFWLMPRETRAFLARHAARQGNKDAISYCLTFRVDYAYGK